jgi:hypothetical protein
VIRDRVFSEKVARCIMGTAGDPHRIAGIDDSSATI